MLTDGTIGLIISIVLYIISTPNAEFSFTISIFLFSSSISLIDTYIFPGFELKDHYYSGIENYLNSPIHLSVSHFLSWLFVRLVRSLFAVHWIFY